MTTRKPLMLEVGKCYTDCHTNVYIVAKLQPEQATDGFVFVSTAGILYTEDGKTKHEANPPLLMEWSVGEGVYCAPDVRGWELLRKYGGNWLGHVHEWIQCNAINGDQVTWGSHEHLRLRSATVFDIENLAASCAAAGINQFAREHYLLRALQRAKEKE